MCSSSSATFHKRQLSVFAPTCQLSCSTSSCSQQRELAHPSSYSTDNASPPQHVRHTCVSPVQLLLISTDLVSSYLKQRARSLSRLAEPLRYLCFPTGKPLNLRLLDQSHLVYCVYFEPSPWNPPLHPTPIPRPRRHQIKMAPSATGEPAPMQLPVISKASTINASVLHGPRDLRLVTTHPFFWSICPKPHGLHKKGGSLLLLALLFLEPVSR